MVKRIIITAAVSVLLFFVPQAWGKMYIDITAPAFQRYPVAVPEFKNLGGGADGKNLASWFSENLSQALDITGFFRIIDKKAFLEDTYNTGITTDEINFADWVAISCDFLIKGGFTEEGGKLSVEFRIFDVVEGKQITGKKYWGTLNERKSMIYKFAAEMLEVLTGDRGVFDTKIAFVGTKGKGSELYTVDFDGSNFRRISDFGSICLSPYWSPDGNHISFTSYRKNNPDHYVMNVKTGKTKRMSSFRGLNLSAPWAPDGRSMLLVLSKEGNEEVYSMDAGGKKIKRITNNPAIDVSPTWSPDGKSIAFVSNRSGSPQIFVMDANGRDVRRLTFQGHYNTSPSWSPRGDRIAYEGITNGHYQIFTIAPGGNNLMQLTYEEGGCEAPSWSPDGMYLTFWSNIKGKAKLCVINANGLNLRVLDTVKGVEAVKSPSWSPRLKLY